MAQILPFERSDIQTIGGNEYAKNNIFFNIVCANPDNGLFRD